MFNPIEETQKLQVKVHNLKIKVRGDCPLTIRPFDNAIHWLQEAEKTLQVQLADKKGTGTKGGGG